MRITIIYIYTPKINKQFCGAWTDTVSRCDSLKNIAKIKRMEGENSPTSAGRSGRIDSDS